MKTVTLPSLQVEPELLEALESVLAEGETVSSFVESTVRRSVQRRKAQAEFIARGLASFAEWGRTGVSYPVEEVVARMTAMLEARRAELLNIAQLRGPARS